MPAPVLEPKLFEDYVANPAVTLDDSPLQLVQDQLRNFEDSWGAALSCDLSGVPKLPLKLFVDGSGSNGHAVPMWALCLCIEDPEGSQSFGGALACKVALMPLDAHYFGADIVPAEVSVAAETSAMCWALL